MTIHYPLQWPEDWPRTFTRRPGKFGGLGFINGTPYRRVNKLTIGAAIQRVLDELGRLNAKDAVICTNLTLRRDGLPYAEQGEPQDPGVAVYWTKGETRKAMAIDHYSKVVQNLAAIAATIEAMRAIARHGGAVVMERAFTGFTALPAPMTCWDVLNMAPTRDAAEIDRRFRELAKQHHPDIGGSHAKMAEITRARDEARSKAT
jgi:hypothetical protein